MNEDERARLEAAVAFHNSRGADADPAMQQRLDELEDQRQRRWQRATANRERAEFLKRQREEEAAQARINAESSTEALSWLQSAGGLRSISGGGGDADMVAGARAIRLVQRLYASGAARVTVLEVSGLLENAEYQDTDALEVELPAEMPARAKIFRQAATHARSRGMSPTLDEGQKYLLLRWE